jgi:hypothetical protein
MIKIEAVCFSETLAPTDECTQRYRKKDNNFMLTSLETLSLTGM